jgi:hypothetical protein
MIQITKNATGARGLACFRTQNVLSRLFDSVNGLDRLTEVGLLLNACGRGRKWAVAAGQAL